MLAVAFSLFAENTTNAFSLLHICDSTVFSHEQMNLCTNPMQLWRVNPWHPLNDLRDAVQIVAVSSAHFHKPLMQGCDLHASITHSPFSMARLHCMLLYGTLPLYGYNLCMAHWNVPSKLISHLGAWIPHQPSVHLTFDKADHSQICRICQNITAQFPTTLFQRVLLRPVIGKQWVRVQMLIVVSMTKLHQKTNPSVWKKPQDKCTQCTPYLAGWGWEKQYEGLNGQCKCV